MGLYLLARLRGHVVHDYNADFFVVHSEGAKNDARGIVLKDAAKTEPLEKLKAAITSVEMNAKPTVTVFGHYGSI